jgi:hypothetical protein
MIYSKIWTSEQFSILSQTARLLYIGTISIADDDGRLRGNPAYLKGQIFPYDDITSDEVLKFRDEIVTAALLICYKVDNYEYLEHPNWTEYQKIRKDMYIPSRLPPSLHGRNGVVTEPLHGRTLNKELNKEIRGERKLSGENPRTPLNPSKRDLLYGNPKNRRTKN